MPAIAMSEEKNLQKILSVAPAISAFGPLIKSVTNLGLLLKSLKNITLPTHF